MRKVSDSSPGQSDGDGSVVHGWVYTVDIQTPDRTGRVVTVMFMVVPDEPKVSQQDGNTDG